MAKFQSTGPLRDPTCTPCIIRVGMPNFNPQVPCGTRQIQIVIISNNFLNFNPQVPCGTRQNQRRGMG